MSLIQDLEKAAELIPISHIPSVDQTAGVVAAIAASIEHGDSFWTAVKAGAEDVSKLLNPTPPAPAADGSEQQSQSVADMQAEIQSLQAQLAAAQKTRLAEAPAPQA